MISDSDTPTLGGVISDAIAARLADVHVGMPGEVVAYDAARQVADVQPLVQRGYRDEDDLRAVETLAVINDVPVIFDGGGDYALTFPVQTGDVVWLSFASCSLAQWKRRDGIVDPGDDRRLHLSDAVAHVGLRNDRHRRASAPTDRARLGRDGGVALEVTSSEVLVGGGVTPHEPTVKHTTRTSAESTFLAALATFTSALGGLPGMTAPATAFNTAVSNFAASLNSHATTVAKVR